MRGLGFFFWWRKGSERVVEVGRKGGVAELHDDASLGGVSLGQRSAWMALRLDGAMLGGFFSLLLLFLYLCATLCTALARPFCCSLLHLCAGTKNNTRIAWRFLLPFTTLLLLLRFPFSTFTLLFALLFCLNCEAPSSELCYRHQGASPRCQGSSPPFKRLRRVINRPEVFYIYPIFINLFCQKFGS